MMFSSKWYTETEYVDKKADETAPASVTELAAQAKDSLYDYLKTGPLISI